MRSAKGLDESQISDPPLLGRGPLLAFCGGHSNLSELCAARGEQYAPPSYFSPSYYCFCLSSHTTIDYRIHFNRCIDATLQ